MVDHLISLRNIATEELMRHVHQRVDPLTGGAIEEKKHKQTKKQLADTIAQYVTVEIAVEGEEGNATVVVGTSWLSKGLLEIEGGKHGLTSQTAINGHRCD